jgi:hypothetical protein
MASSVNAVLCALLATAFWTALGYAVTRLLLPRVLAFGVSPVIGWAVFSAASLPVLRLTGFSLPALVGAAALCLVAAGASLVIYPSLPADAAAPAIPLWSYVAAAVLALVPAVAILPKFPTDGVHLADPIFDHSKIAIIDAMTRQGLPPVNPVFGEFDAAGRLAYYYLWHFSAAELALPLRASGWEADTGLTWFTAFASLAVMMGVAVWISRKSNAAFAVVALAAATSLREAFSLLSGSYSPEPFMATPTGFAGWLFQSAWVPQHLMSASCAVVALVLVVHYAQRQSLALLLTLALVVVAGFESSTYVGGVTFGIAAIAAAPILLAGYASVRRKRIAAGLAGAAVLALVLAAPFLLDQFGTVAARGSGSPIVLHHFEVLGNMFPVTLRRALDWGAYWFILLPFEFPATYIAGLIALAVMLPGAASGPEKTTVAILAALAAVGLGVSWLLVSTIGDNNDLALRAVLPAAMVLIIVAAAGMMRLSAYRMPIVALALGGIVLSLPDTARMVWLNVEGRPAADGAVFAQTPELWAAVRRYAAPTARVADNPLFLQDLTPWAANMSWALLADRSSCFAGREMALAFAPLPPARREAINEQFIRVFAGQAMPGDVTDMAKKFACDVVVVVPQDGAWANDPFAASVDYRLAETRDGRWRIYVKTPAGTAPAISRRTN